VEQAQAKGWSIWLPYPTPELIALVAGADLAVMHDSGRCTWPQPWPADVAIYGPTSPGAPAVWTADAVARLDSAVFAVLHQARGRLSA